MKDWTKDILASLVTGLVIPGIALNGAAALKQQAQPEPEPIPVSLSVRVRDRDTVTEADMDAYLTGVLLAEMPASFEPDALKAQAVVARTYARKAYETGGKHGDSSVCTDPGCCQGYTAPAEQEGLERIRQAVAQTSGQVLTWEGELIEATYFSCSGGMTEDAVSVWGTDFPYLRSVESPGEEQAAHFRDTVVFTPAELEAALEIVLTDSREPWIGKITYTRGGSVDTAILGGKAFSGLELRAKLGLRSAAFNAETTESGIAFTTRGFGHRVGLSQYGADAMAAAGHSYVEILAHYYQGTELTQLKDA